MICCSRGDGAAVRLAAGIVALACPSQDATDDLTVGSPRAISPEPAIWPRGVLRSGAEEAGQKSKGRRGTYAVAESSRALANGGRAAETQQLRTARQARCDGA